MSKQTDITNLIERMIPLEERLEITVEGLFANFEKHDEDNSYVRLNGELHTVNGLELNEDISLVLSMYDSNGRVVATDDTYFNSDSFHMFETFSFILSTSGIYPAKLRLYPKKS